MESRSISKVQSTNYYYFYPLTVYDLFFQMITVAYKFVTVLLLFIDLFSCLSICVFDYDMIASRAASGMATLNI